MNIPMTTAISSIYYGYEIKKKAAKPDRSPYSKEERAAVLKMSARGTSYKKISEETRIPISTVKSWVFNNKKPRQE